MMTRAAIDAWSPVKPGHAQAEAHQDDAQRLADEEREGVERHGRGARCRRDLGHLSLEGVVEHVEAEAHEHHGGGIEPPVAAASEASSAAPAKRPPPDQHPADAEAPEHPASRAAE